MSAAADDPTRLWLGTVRLNGENAMHRMLFVTIALALLLSACAPAAPTVSPEQVQASAMAAASTMIALTVAAVPTSTPAPPTPLPTDTPLPSPTVGLLPTLANAPAPTTASGGGDDCNHIFDVGASGPTATLVVNNNTKGSISGSVWLNTQNRFAQCGYITFGPIGKGQSGSIDVPLVHTNMGDTCYWAGAWVNDPKRQTQPNGGPFCIDSTLKWVLNVNYDKITISPP